MTLVLTGLMHWPAPMLDDYEGPDKGYTWQQTWEAMVQVFRDNPDKVRAVGASAPRLYSTPVK